MCGSARCLYFHPTKCLANNSGFYGPLTSTSQNCNAASKVDIVFLPTQGLDLFTHPMVPGAGKEYIVQVAPDFDDTLEFGN
jgi:hypothetical protein